MFLKKEITSKEYAPYYDLYLDRVEGNTSLIEGLLESKQSFLDFIDQIPAEKYHYAYAEGKWTVKEMIQHVIDTERIFCYRALRIARGDQTPLPGFDENAFVPPSKANHKSIQQLREEYATLRASNLSLFKSFQKEMLLALGEASGTPISVRAVPFILIGHEKHHIFIYTSRY
jgi:uncharacterized damage-inducible protein DinB